MLDSFHFLRPYWLIALIPATGLVFRMLRNGQAKNQNWAEHCDAHLLPHLIMKYKTSAQTLLPFLLFSCWLVATLALAGPTWSQYAQPVYQKNTARVIALDVSQSMNSNDVAPTRLQRAKYKVLDLLHALKEGQTGMVVFSSSAFVVSPLTSDSNTIASMVPVLDSSIVPVQGSDITKALQKSARLIAQAGYSQGQIILITDSSPSAEAVRVATELAAQGYSLSVLAIGSAEGGPVSGANGSFETDENGNVVFAHLDSSGLAKLAAAGGGNYVMFRSSNLDIAEVLQASNLPENSKKSTQEILAKNLWKDQGHWLIWLLLGLCAMMARKGWLEKIC